jgi:hypothetical protein
MVPAGQARDLGVQQHEEDAHEAVYRCNSFPSRAGVIATRHLMSGMGLANRKNCFSNTGFPVRGSVS